MWCWAWLYFSLLPGTTEHYRLNTVSQCSTSKCWNPRSVPQHMWCWGLNPELHECWTSSLPTKLHSLPPPPPCPTLLLSFVSISKWGAGMSEG
ncbi:mCG1051126 [Mus musculus]|nr:mCG1051126 [Mus musculus]